MTSLLICLRELNIAPKTVEDVVPICPEGASMKLDVAVSEKAAAALAALRAKLPK